MEIFYYYRSFATTEPSLLFFFWWKLGRSPVHINDRNKLIMRSKASNCMDPSLLFGLLLYKLIIIFKTEIIIIITWKKMRDVDLFAKVEGQIQSSPVSHDFRSVISLIVGICLIFKFNWYSIHIIKKIYIYIFFNINVIYL